MKKYVYPYAFLFLVAGVIIALDQWTKSIVRANLGIGEQWMPIAWLAPHVRIVNWYNTGVAFGMFQGMGSVFMVLAIIVAVAIVYYYPRVSGEDWLLRLALSLQLAGAVGNLIDRVTNNGNVTDFMAVGDFPVFNVADASITVGVAVLLVGVWLQERRMKAQEQAAQPQDSGEVPPLDQQPS